MSRDAIVRSPGFRRPALFYAAAAAVLACFPLVGILHVEAAAILAFFAFFASGLEVLGRDRTVKRHLLEQETALVVPWTILTLTLLVRPNCGYLQGVVFYLLFPPVSVALAVGAAVWLKRTALRRKRLCFVVGGLLVAGLAPIYDLGLHPQFYVYNHVFGGVLGPIYDEELTIRPGLVVFRLLTLLWAFLFLLSDRLRSARRGVSESAARAGGSGDTSALEAARRRLGRTRAAWTGTVLLIGAGYAFAAPLGINTPSWYLQERLGAVHRTDHFDIYYDPASFSPEQLDLIAAEHEHHYARLASITRTTLEDRIESYLYPNPEVKAALTGARVTNVAPVWLPTPQTHVLARAFRAVFPHELAHVFSRPSGLPIVHASLSVGLVEGWAVALEPPDGDPALDDLVSVALATGTGLPEGRLHDVAEAVASRLSPFGFWMGRGAVSYTTMGSFVHFLLDAYGVERLKAVYATANFEEVYGREVDSLAAEWVRRLAARPAVARAAAGVVERRFTVPSLLEQPCPHHVPAYVRDTRRAAAAAARGDTAEARERVGRALRRLPGYEPALDLWARLTLANDPEQVAARLADRPEAERSPLLTLRLGQALAVARSPRRAEAALKGAYDALPVWAHGERAELLAWRAVSGCPSLVRELVTRETPRGRTEGPAFCGETWAAEYLRALQLAGEARYAEAAAALDALSDLPPDAPRGHRLLIRRQQLAARARFAYLAGRPREAVRPALQAARLYRAAGDDAAASAYVALAERARWIERAPRT